MRKKRAMIMKLFMIAVVSMVLPIKMMLMSAAVVTILWDVILRKGLAIPQAMIFTTVLIARTAKRSL